MTLFSALTGRGRWIAGFAGAMLPLSFAPFHLYFLTPLLLAVLYFLCDRQTGKEAAWRGFWFGFGAFAAGTYWLYISIHIFGGAPIAVAVFLMLGLVLPMSAYVAATGYLFVAVESAPLMLRCCLLWPACWTLMEWLRGWLFSGFPWLSLGYGQIDGPLSAWAPLLGVYGVTFISAVLAGILFVMFRGMTADRLIAALIALVVIGSTAAIRDRAWTQAIDHDLRVSLIQGAIPQDRKWLPDQRQPTLDLYRDLTFSLPDPDLVIWPEAAVPALAYQVQDFLDEMDNAAQNHGMQLLIGVLTYDFDRDQYRNSILALGPQNSVYHKRHLVPFGEYFPVPGFIRDWIRMMNLPYQDTAAGVQSQPLLRVGEIPLALTICYEDAFGAEQLGYLPDAQLLVNVSNDAWFGDSIAPHQHLQMARMRALEAGRFMLRATNTGVTAIISPRGEIIQRSPQFRAHVLSDIVQPYKGSTPYVRVGNFPVVVSCLLLVGLGWYRGSWTRPKR